MYAPRIQPVASPVVVRLIGALDGELVAAFSEIERRIAPGGATTVLVDVSDLNVLGDAEMGALAGAIARARLDGRDVRLDARSLHWRRVAKQRLSTQPAIDAKLRSVVRRTVILAHSIRRSRPSTSSG